MLRATNFLASVLILAITAHAQNAASIPQTVQLKRGQTISLSLLTPLDSGHANLGDDVTLKLVRPLVADSATVLPTDWIVHGAVTKVKRAGKNCQGGEIEWKLGPIKTPAGDLLPVQEVRYYPFKYHVNSGDPVWVPLGTPLTKIGGAAKVVVLLPVAVVLSPLLIPMAVAMSRGDCTGEMGRKQSLPMGRGQLYAVSKSVRLRTLP